MSAPSARAGPGQLGRAAGAPQRRRARRRRPRCRRGGGGGHGAHRCSSQVTGDPAAACPGSTSRPLAAGEPHAGKPRTSAEPDRRPVAATQASRGAARRLHAARGRDRILGRGAGGLDSRARAARSWTSATPPAGGSSGSTRPTHRKADPLADWQAQEPAVAARLPNYAAHPHRSGAVPRLAGRRLGVHPRRLADPRAQPQLWSPGRRRTRSTGRSTTSGGRRACPLLEVALDTFQPAPADRQPQFRDLRQSLLLASNIWQATHPSYGPEDPMTATEERRRATGSRRRAAAGRDRRERARRPQGRRGGARDRVAQRRASARSCSSGGSGSTSSTRSRRPIPASRSGARRSWPGCSEFLEREVDGAAIERDARIPDRVLRGLADIGCLGMKIDTEYGGLGLSQLVFNQALMMIGSANPSIGALISAHQSIGVPQPVKLFGTAEQKQRFLPALRADRHQRLPAHRARRRIRPGPTRHHRDPVGGRQRRTC